MPDKKINFPKRIPRTDALQILNDNISPVPSTTVPVAECSAFIAAEDIHSGVSLPEHDRSAMDGFALPGDCTSGASVEHPVILKYYGEIRPSETTRCNSDGKCAVRVLTGGIIPQGTDAVIPFERVTINSDTIEVSAPVRKGEFIRKSGSDIMKGELIAKCKTPISPCDAALLAYAGVRAVPVRRPLSMSALAIGNELCDPERENVCGLIPADNLILLKSLCNQFGIMDINISPCANSPESIAEAINKNYACDLIITTGGTGPGNRDFVFNSILEAGGKPLFKGLAMHPAKSVFACKTAGSIVLGLPGPPNAVNLAFHTIVKPVMNILQGRKAIPRIHTAKLTEDLKGSDGREKMRPCLISEEHGVIIADPLISREMSPRKIMSVSNGIIVLPPDCGDIKKGKEVQIIKYG